MVCAQTVIKIVNGGCWGLSGRQAQKEWLVWGSESVGRCTSRAPGEGAIIAGLAWLPYWEIYLPPLMSCLRLQPVATH